jgi:membrane protease YdiL (CAAX protease family)
LWNQKERRPRALWRLIAQAVLFLLAGLLVQGVLSVSLRSALSTLGQEIGSAGATLLFQTLFHLTPLLYTGLSVWLASRFLDRRHFAGLGLRLTRDWWVDLGFGLALGALLMAGVFLVQLAAGWIRVDGTFVTRNPGIPFPLAILSPLAICIAVGIYEELLSRGYQLRNMAEAFGVTGPAPAIIVAAVLSSAIFGALHALNPNATVISSTYIFLAALVFLSLGCVLTGELAIPIGTHISWNFFQGHVFGFPISGASYGTATFIETREQGPDLWTGGAFGPEAGLVGLMAVFVGGLLIVSWVRWRYGRVGLFTNLAEPPQRMRARPHQEELIDDVVDR